MIKEDIRTKMYEAMRANEKSNKLVYSMMLDSIQKAEKTAQKEMSDNEVIPLIQKQIKQCKETLEFARKAGNETVINNSSNEIHLLEAFLPQMMSEQEISAFLANVFTAIQPIKSNKGKIMKECAVLRGKADMKMVAQMVDAQLA